MAEAVTGDKAKQHVWEKAGGDLVEIYIPENGMYKEGHSIPYSINGYRGAVIVGKRCKVTQDVVTMLKQCKSNTAVPNLDAVDPDKRGVPRKQEDFYNVATKSHHQQDFKVEILKEL